MWRKKWRCRFRHCQWLFSRRTTVPDPHGSPRLLSCTTEGASVLAVLADLNFLHHFPEGIATIGIVITNDPTFLVRLATCRKLGQNRQSAFFPQSEWYALLRWAKRKGLPWLTWTSHDSYHSTLRTLPSQKTPSLRVKGTTSSGYGSLGNSNKSSYQ